MSRLFDRLCELAIADRLTVTVYARLPAATDDESVRLAEVLVRGARARQFSMWLIHPGPTHPNVDRDIVIDLDLLADDDAEDALTALVPPPTSGGWFVHVEQGLAVVGEGASTTIASLGNEPDRSATLRRCIASDHSDLDELATSLGSHDLGITVGGQPAPGIHVVDDPAELLVVVDALLVLRHVAFGTDSGREPDSDHLLSRPRLRSLLAS